MNRMRVAQGPFRARGPGRSGAFTLIEVLVVIGIITVLAGLLIPVIASARESARQTTCQANMRELHKAIMMFATDHNGSLPPNSSTYMPWRSLRRTAGESHFLMLLAPDYIKQLPTSGLDEKAPAKVFYCPSSHYRSPASSFSVYASGGRTAWPVEGVGNGWGASAYCYFGNSTLAVNDGHGEPIVWPTGKTRTSADKLLLCDIAAKEEPDWATYPDDPDRPFGSRRYLYNHLGSALVGMNALWADGHVKWYDEEACNPHVLGPDASHSLKVYWPDIP